MEILIGEENVPPDKLSYRPLGFGQHAHEKQLRAFSIRLTLAELNAAASESFDLFAKEIKQDDECYGDPVEALQAIDYADFATAMRTGPRSVEQVLVEYLPLQFLEGLLGMNDTSGCTHVINSLATLEIGDKFVVLTGEAYEVSKS